MTVGAYTSVLFDLDGTLVDTAPDLVGVLHDMLQSHDREPIPYELARSHVSNGAIGLLNLGFPEVEHYYMSPMHVEFLERYEQRVCVDSRLFDAMPELLEELDLQRVAWGIVTNKPAGVTRLLLDALDLSSRSACTVAGDTLDERKPHPAPLLHACDIAGMLPQTTVYVGDARRDVEAGKAAGMGTIAAAYGYITDDDDPVSWGADCLAGDPAEAATMVRKAVNL